MTPTMPNDTPTPDPADAVASALREALLLTSGALVTAATGERIIRFTGKWAYLGARSISSILDQAEAALARSSSPADDRSAVTALKITANRLPAGSDRDAAWGALDLIARLSRERPTADQRVTAWLREMDVALHEAENLAEGRTRDLVASTHARLHEVSARLEGERPASPARVPDEVVPKSDAQIVEEVNSVARILLGLVGIGFDAPDGFRFYEAPQSNFRARKAWSFAVEVYEHLTKTEVHDALLAVEEDAPAITPSERHWRHDPEVEVRAQSIYETWSHLHGYVPWILHGNSLKQDEARDKARAAIADQERAARAGSGQDGGTAGQGETGVRDV